jgi:hypothetical protein
MRLKLRVKLCIVQFDTRLDSKINLRNFFHPSLPRGEEKGEGKQENVNE